MKPINIRRAAIHAILAAAAFAVAGACIKAASDTPNAVVVFVRCSVSLLTLLPWLLRHGPSALKTRRLGGHLWRAAFGVAAMYCFFYAIGALPLATAVLLAYSTPLWVPFIAWGWIAEKPPLIVFPAALLGLAGITLIVKPDAHTFNGSAALIGLASGVLAACAMVGIRRIADTEPAERVVFYFALLATLTSSVPLLWSWQTPSLQTLVELAAAGVFATLGQLQLTRAYAFAPAARVGPFSYSAVLFSALLAWWLWDERLDLLAAVGTLLVIASALLAGWRRKPAQGGGANASTVAP